MIDSIKRFFGIAPRWNTLTYEQQCFVVAVSTCMERVK
jgi:hypothetical protein